MAAHHSVAKEAHRAWVLAGRPREGPVLDHKKVTNTRYKNAVRYVSKHEQVMRADSMAKKLLGNDVTGFWKEVKALNRSNTSLPNNIEGVTLVACNIAELWRQHYSVLFNCIKSDPYEVGNCDANDSVGISANEVYLAISQLADNKASGSDLISAEHLKDAGPKVAVPLAICFIQPLCHMAFCQNPCWLLHLSL